MNMKQQGMVFLLTGVLNTLVGYSIYALFISLGWNYQISILVATILGILFNFKSIGIFVFKNSNNSLFIRFVIVYTVIYFINIGLVATANKVVNNLYLSGFLSVLICAGLAFFLNKFFVFEVRPKS